MAMIMIIHALIASIFFCIELLSKLRIPPLGHILFFLNPWRISCHPVPIVYV